VHDAITLEPALERGGGFGRTGNHAGGLEGGITTGQPLVVRAAMKPISTLMSPLATVDLRTGAAAEAVRERSDVCAVPAAGVVAEAMVAIVLADAVLEKFGGDSLAETRRNLDGYLEAIRRRGAFA
jgi:chorismate synthase